MHKFWYDYVQPKYEDSFIFYIKHNYFGGIAEDVEKRLDTLN